MEKNDSIECSMNNKVSNGTHTQSFWCLDEWKSKFSELLHDNGQKNTVEVFDCSDWRVSMIPKDFFDLIFMVDAQNLSK